MADSDSAGATGHGLRGRMESWRRGLLGIREGQDNGWYWAAIRSQHPPFSGRGARRRDRHRATAR